MQEEVAKHTEKIYKTIKNKEHGAGEKIKEIAIEIGIIVFAVTLSIWLHGWSDHRQEQKETNEFLRGLKSDLAKDIRELQENKATFSKVDSDFQFLRRLNDSHQIDTASNQLITHYLDFSMSVTHANVGRYEGFKSSGKIGTIEDDSLKQEILEYYQQTIPGVGDIEGIANTFEQKLIDMEVSKEDKENFRELAKSFKMRALLEFATDNIEAVNRYYDSTTLQAKKIGNRIDQYEKD
jgi:Family of unknown function (DUF6090)